MCIFYFFLNTAIIYCAIFCPPYFEAEFNPCQVNVLLVCSLKMKGNQRFSKVLEGKIGLNRP